MPDLKHSLHGHDLGHLRIVAERWGVTLSAPDSSGAADELITHLLDVSLILDVIGALAQEPCDAIQALAANDGQMPWVQFTRIYGEIREMGSGRRDRTRPDKDPISAAETLWYHALMARDFFSTDRGSQEFAYIPDDLRALLPGTFSAGSTRTLGRPATPTERALEIPANDRLLDHVCTLLAARRADLPITSVIPDDVLVFLDVLLPDAGLLESEGQPNIEKSRVHLESSRAEALNQLAHTWLHSAEHNDLHCVPSLAVEGAWVNHPLVARTKITSWLSALPENTWWSLSAFVADIHQAEPDFQRPAGDYDSWYLRDAESGQFLRGFEHWDDVDGALIRYLICGPLHWLGMIDLAAPEGDEPSPVTAFRLSSWADALLGGTPPDIPEQPAQIHISSQGRIDVPHLASRSARYQLARFCRWEKDTQHEYRYRIMPETLARAKEQGLEVAHLLSLLNKHVEHLPPNITRALKSWQHHGTQARLEKAVILHLSTPEILTALRASRASRFLGVPLSPTAIVVKPGAEDKIIAALVEIGYLGKIDFAAE
ncbi:MAG: helicase-associated domain-containing protein [Chloroflexota bacterium]